MRRVAAMVAAVLAVVLVLGGCTATPGPGPARIDVDTPELREAKVDAGVEPCVPGAADPVEGGLPAVTLPCFGGGPDVDLSTLRGPMVVNLWASWCGPCRREMPILQGFHERHGEEVAVLGVDYQDSQPAAAMELVSDSGVTYPLLADPQGALDGAAPLPAMAGMPFLAFVDGDGRIAHQAFVIIEDQQQLVDLVEEHLGVRL